MKLNIALIFGGKSAEHEVSIRSATTVLSGLSQEKYNVLPIYITKKGKWILYEGAPFPDLSLIDWETFGTRCALSLDPSNRGLIRIIGDRITYLPLDVIFPVIHGTGGEDGSLQGLFELAQIPYVGCDLYSSAIGFDKEISRIIADRCGIKQTKYLTYKREEVNETTLDATIKEIRQKINYPCFVKPARQGSSIGITKAGNKKEVADALELAFNFDSKILVEKNVTGREVETAVLGGEVSGVGEVLPAAEFYDYDAKYNSVESKTVIPIENAPESVIETVRAAALAIFKAIGASGLSRVDFFIDGSDVYFNEINTLPGFTSISMYPTLWAERGVTLPQLCDKLVELAFQKK
jgi:D-alanine-D-alanine ligase